MRTTHISEGGATRSAADADDAESLSSVSSADPSAAPSGEQGTLVVQGDGICVLRLYQFKGCNVNLVVK